MSALGDIVRKYGKDVYRCVPTCGVYLLVRAGIVVYVGQSVNVYTRIESHTDKTFDAAYFLPCFRGELIEIERELINVYRPEYNKTGVVAYIDQFRQIKKRDKRLASELLRRIEAGRYKTQTILSLEEFNFIGERT